MRGKPIAFARRTTIVRLAATMLLAAATCDAWAQSYVAIDLTPTGYSSAMGWGISGSQQVGYASGVPTGGNRHAMLWSGTAASAVDLNPPGFDESFLFAADGSQQAGWAESAAFGGNGHAYLWSGTPASGVDLNPTGYTLSAVYGMSGSQQVGQGSGPATDGHPHALVWSSTAGSAVDLNPVGSLASYAYGTNGSQQVGVGHGHAMLWSGTAESAIDLHPSGFLSSVALGISGTQQVGSGRGPNTNGSDHALLWNGTAASVIDLNPNGFSESGAHGTNGVQQVGGGSGPITGYLFHALLWSGSAASALDLHQFLPPGFTESEALAIASNGDIVGSAWVSSPEHPAAYDEHAILWRCVPEPTVLTMVTIGGVLLLTFKPRWRRTRTRGIAITAVFTAVSASSTLAQNSLTWTGGANDGGHWSTVGNWDPSGPPTESSDVYIDNGDTVVIDDSDIGQMQDAAKCHSLHLGSTNSSDAGTLTIQGGAELYIGNDAPWPEDADVDPDPADNLYVGEHGTGTLDIVDGSVHCYGTAYVAPYTNNPGPDSLGAINVHGSAYLWVGRESKRGRS